METLREFVATVGPEIVYLLLMLGIWLAITAIYIAGTGIPEMLATILGGLGVTGLLFLPTNLSAFILLVLGVACFIANIIRPRAWYLAIIGGALQLAGSIFLFKVGSRPSIWSILLINAATIAYHQFILRPGLRIQNRPRMLDDETLIGQYGEVVSPLDPVGTVRVQGELWRARATQTIEAGRQVRVVKRDGLEIHVTTGEPSGEIADTTPQAT